MGRVNKQSLEERLIMLLIKISTRLSIRLRFLPDLVCAVVVMEWFPSFFTPSIYHLVYCEQEPPLPDNLISTYRNELMGS